MTDPVRGAEHTMSLPLLPGYPHQSPKVVLGKTRHFEFKNGIPVAKKPVIELTPEEVEALENYSPASPSVKNASSATLSLPPVVPAHVLLDKKVGPVLAVTRR